MSSNNSDAASAAGTYATFISGKIMLGAIIILFVVVVVLVFLHLYARWYLLRSRRGRNNHARQTHLVFYLDPSSPVAAKRGLDASLLETIPTFTYPKEKDVIMECAVCLSEFEEDEAGRQLPGCGHCFHVGCIDMWFHSHSTCPLCRSPVNAQIIPILANESSSVADSMVIKIEVETSEPELEKRPLPSWGSGTSCGAAAAGDFDVEQG